MRVSSLYLLTYAPLRILSSTAAAATPAMGETPDPKLKLCHSKDEDYLHYVIPKRISLFESIKAQQIEESQRIGGESINIVVMVMESDLEGSERRDSYVVGNEIWAELSLVYRVQFASQAALAKLSCLWLRCHERQNLSKKKLGRENSCFGGADQLGDLGVDLGTTLLCIGRRVSYSYLLAYAPLCILSSTAAMRPAMGETPDPKLKSCHSKDEDYLHDVIPKRISLFESIKVQQTEERQRIDGESIKNPYAPLHILSSTTAERPAMGETPNPKLKPGHSKDKDYLHDVIPKRISLFEFIKAQQIEERQRIGGESIKRVSSSYLLAYAPLCILSSTAAARPVMGETPDPKLKPCHSKDEDYFHDIIPKRISLFESIKAQQIEERQRIGGESIKVTLPDGTVKEGKKWITSPLDIAKGISKSLAASALISQHAFQVQMW
ncbi:hypothetical protein HHK36_028045 [Tetracentron sinense]|uniref:TGS domain-containing protein n=1 Tax=Tetracentron sinense TaxID=13715 RepID=A0A835D1L6_TETSI|nr:hypothetical protein HHK36_028045 [Tetracentron sinense]